MGSPTAPLVLTLSDLERSLKAKTNGAVGLPIYDFLLVSNSNYMSNSHRLGVIAARKISNFAEFRLIMHQIHSQKIMHTAGEGLYRSCSKSCEIQTLDI